MKIIFDDYSTNIYAKTETILWLNKNFVKIENEEILVELYYNDKHNNALIINYYSVDHQLIKSTKKVNDK